MPTLEEHVQAGMAAIEAKRFDDAIEAFQSALDVDPNRPDMNHALGMAYLHRGDAGNAIPLLEKAVELAEPYTADDVQALKRDFHVTLSTAYQLMDRVAEARRTLEGIVQRWPDEIEPRLQLAQLLCSSCLLDDGLAVYKAAEELLDGDVRKAVEAVRGSVEAFMASDEIPNVFLRGHQESYKEYFDEVAEAQAEQGWIAEAARMARGPDGEPTPIVADGARPYALSRVDLVDPSTGKVSGVYSEQEPMVVALKGMEPLAEMPILLPWKGWSFDVWVCTRCPWHWLTVMVQFRAPADTPEALVERIDPTVGSWYLAGYNGEFGDKESGRFHYVTDPEISGDRAVSYVFDLGRASYDAIEALMRRLVVLHDTHPIQRVLFGYGRLPD